MAAYEAPTLTKVGAVADLTQGQLFQPGQDFLSWIPIIGPLFGDKPPSGGGFGS